MKKRFCILRALLLGTLSIAFWGGSSAQSVDNIAFLGDIKLGMSPVEVIACVGEDPDVHQPNQLAYAPQKIMGKDAAAMYNFIDEKLVSVFLQFTEIHKEDSAYYDDFCVIDDVLIEEYGQPSREKDYNLPGVAPDSNEDEIKRAIVSGEYSVTTFWNGVDSSIIHGIHSEDRQIYHTLMYISIER